MAGEGRPPTSFLAATDERRGWPAFAGHDTGAGSPPRAKMRTAAVRPRQAGQLVATANPGLIQPLSVTRLRARDETSASFDRMKPSVMAGLVPANYATPALVQMAGTGPAMTMLRWPERLPIRLFRPRPLIRQHGAYFLAPIRCPERRSSPHPANCTCSCQGCPKSPSDHDERLQLCAHQLGDLRRQRCPNRPHRACQRIDVADMADQHLSRDRQPSRQDDAGRKRSHALCRESVSSAAGVTQTRGDIE